MSEHPMQVQSHIDSIVKQEEEALERSAVQNGIKKPFLKVNEARPFLTTTS